MTGPARARPHLVVCAVGLFHVAFAAGAASNAAGAAAAAESVAELKAVIAEKNAVIAEKDAVISRQRGALRALSPQLKQRIIEESEAAHIQICDGKFQGRCDQPRRVHHTSLGENAAWFNMGPGRPHQGKACTDEPSAGLAGKNETCAGHQKGFYARKCKHSPLWREHQYCQQSCYDRGQGYDGDDCKDDTGKKSCRRSENCNPAKCYGDWQDNRRIYGNLDCESAPKNGIGEHKGSECLDNLSGGAFFVSSGKGSGMCKSFGDSDAFHRKTYYDTSGGVRNSVIAKLLIGHPNKAERHIGVIAGKRMVCHKAECQVFKTGYCIKCPADIFKQKYEGDTTQDDANKFYHCCISGRSTYKLMNGTTENCDGKFQTTGGNPPGPFNATNSKWAVLKPEYECDEHAVDYAIAMLKVF